MESTEIAEIPVLLFICHFCSKSPQNAKKNYSTETDKKNHINDNILFQSQNYTKLLRKLKYINQSNLSEIQEKTGKEIREIGGLLRNFISINLIDT